MPPQNLETVRLVYERWAAGDFSAGAELFDEATVFILSPDFPDAGIYLGPVAISDYMRGFLEPWKELTVTALHLSEISESIVAEVHQQGSGRLSGAETGFDYFQIWTFRGPSVVRLENIMSRGEAYAAVGTPD